MENHETIPWMDGNSDWGSTAKPSAIGGGDSAAVLAAVIIGVLLAVSLLFSLALFIDCRHRKLEAAKSASPRRKKVLGKFPMLSHSRAVNADSISFANKLCTENTMTVPVFPPPSEEMC